MNISVVIPLLNEEESLRELHEWIARVMEANNFSYEILFIDDGSTDDSWNIIHELTQKHAEVKAFVFYKTMESRKPYMLVLKKRLAKLSLRWMQICKTVPTRFPTYTNSSQKKNLIWFLAGKRSVMIQFSQKTFRQNYSIGPPDVHRVLNFMILIAD